jgi:hypothetical protein
VRKHASLQHNDHEYLPNVNAVLLLLSRLEYKIRIVLCPLVVVVKL